MIYSCFKFHYCKLSHALWNRVIRHRNQTRVLRFNMEKKSRTVNLNSDQQTICNRPVHLLHRQFIDSLTSVAADSTSCSWEPNTNSSVILCVGEGTQGIKSCLMLPRCCFWDRCREVWRLCPHADTGHVTNSADGPAGACIPVTWGPVLSVEYGERLFLTQVIEALTEAVKREASHPDKAGLLWAEGQGLCQLPVSSGRDPSLPSTQPGSNTPIHHSPSLVFSQGSQQCFAAIFLPPLVAVSQGRLCSNITDTGWRSGSNE